MLKSLKEKYNRQIIVSNIGIEGQKKLLSSSVLIVGFGGLGNSVAMYLVRMGIGRIGIIDDDTVDISNIPRQILFTEKDMGKSKIKSGAEKLKYINSELTINEYEIKLNEKNSKNIIPNYDVVIDCTDNIKSRLIINRVCTKYSIPCIYGAINEFYGSVNVYLNKNTACYECMNNNIDIKEKKTGVIGAMVGLVATIQCVETLKILLNIGKVSYNELIIINGLTMELSKIPIKINKECLCRGKNGNNNK